MKARIVVQLDAQGGVTVVSNTADVEVLVLDADIEGTDKLVHVDDDAFAVDSLLDGVAKVDPDRVRNAFEAVGTQLSAHSNDLAVPQRDRIQMGYLSKALTAPD